MMIDNLKLMYGCHPVSDKPFEEQAMSGVPKPSVVIFVHLTEESLDIIEEIQDELIRNNPDSCIIQEFWNNVEESLRVYNRLSLCITEKNGVEGVPNSKLDPHKDIHVGDVSECHRKRLKYNVHISFCLPQDCRTLLTSVIKRHIDKHPWMKKIL